MSSEVFVFPLGALGCSVAFVAVELRGMMDSGFSWDGLHGLGFRAVKILRVGFRRQ